MIASLTGLTWSFNWFRKFSYAITGGGELKPYVLPQSNIDNTTRAASLLDVLYVDLKDKNPLATTFYFALPQDSTGVFRVSVVHKRILTIRQIIYSSINTL